MRGRALPRGDARSDLPRKGGSSVPGALRGVRPSSSGSSEVVRFGARGPVGLRSVATDFGVSWVKGVQCSLLVFALLGSGIRCWSLVRLGVAGVLAVAVSAGIFGSAGADSRKLELCWF